MADDTPAGTDPSLYQLVLCDDNQVHAIYDDTIMCSALNEGEPWIGVCGEKVAVHLERRAGEANVCQPCLDNLTPSAQQAPWTGKTL